MGYENPLLALPAMRKVLALPVEQRRPLEALMRDLRAATDKLAEESWSKRKGPMAAYWRAVSTYSRHVAHALSRGAASVEQVTDEGATPQMDTQNAATREAVKAAAAAIYFNDSSDYERALWTVLRTLAPEVHQALERGERQGLFDSDMNLLWKPGQGMQQEPTPDASDDDGATVRRERQR